MVLTYLFLRFPEIKLSNSNPFDVLKNEIFKNVFLCYPPNDTLVSGTDTNLYHLIVVKNFPDKNLLIGYIELFGFLSAVVIIDNNYKELKEIESVYLYDLVNIQKLSEKHVSLDDLENLNFSNPSYDETLIDSLKIRYGATIKDIMTIQKDRELSRLVDSYFNNPKNIKYGEIITEKHIGEFVNTLMPFFASQLSTRFIDKSNKSN